MGLQHDARPRVSPAMKRLPPVLVLAFAVIVAQACGAEASTSRPTSTAARTSEPTVQPVTSVDSVPTGTPAPRTDPSLAGDSYRGMPISLEMVVGCGLCGSGSWTAESPRFRLYADGTAVFRGPGDDRSTAPYRFVQLPDRHFEELLATALDDGGLRGAEARYPGDTDDAGETTLAMHAVFFDDDANVDVVIEPLSADASVDRNGDPVTDRPRRERLEAFADVLDDFDSWLADRGVSAQPYVPEVYAAALMEPTGETAERGWPWDDVEPGDFASAGSAMRLARVSPAQAARTGVGPGGGDVGIVPFRGETAVTLLIRPVLPGDDRPGMFGLRSDSAALAVEPDLRVRSLPEVSDASERLTPLLRAGDALYILGGPVAGSGYEWYEVHAPRADLTGWVAAAAKTGEEWIRPAPLSCAIGGGDDPAIDLGPRGVELERLACSGDVEFSGLRFLGPAEGDGLRCPDALEWYREPGWLDTQIECSYEFRSEEIDTGGHDPIVGGTLHPSVADLPETLLAAKPAGLVVEVTGRYDHPDARECRAVPATADTTTPPASWVRLDCRLIFVITAMQPVE